MNLDERMAFIAKILILKPASIAKQLMNKHINEIKKNSFQM